MSATIGDPRKPGESGPAGDQRKAGVAGDPRPAGEATVKGAVASTDDKPAKKTAPKRKSD